MKIELEHWARNSSWKTSKCHIEIEQLYKPESLHSNNSNEIVGDSIALFFDTRKEPSKAIPW